MDGMTNLSAMYRDGSMGRHREQNGFALIELMMVVIIVLIVAAAVLLAGYWVALFVATHLPRVPIQFASPNADKWEHLAAYGLLVEAFYWMNQPRDASVIGGVVLIFGLLVIVPAVVHTIWRRL